MTALKWVWALPAFPLSLILALGFDGASGSAILLSVAAFAVSVLLCNPFRVLDFLPRRFRICISSSAVIVIPAFISEITAAARAGLLLTSAGIILLSIRRLSDWKQQDWLRQSPEVDRILADIGHQVRNVAFDNWVSHGRAESRALLHQVAGIEISEAKLEASHMPVYCLGYFTAARRVKKLEQLLADEKKERQELAQRFSDVLDRERQANSEIEDLRESLAKSEKTCEALRGRVDDLSGKLSGMKKIHEEDLAEIERLEGLTADETTCDTPEDRNVRMMREYDNGASYSQLAEQYNLSKSGVRFAIQKARDACADAS